MSSRVLIVEDEEAIALTLEDRLRAEGYAVETRGDGDSGLAAAKDGFYDVLILDIMLPKLDGLSVCRELRAAKNTVPILMLSAKGEVVDRVVGLKFGADDYLPKPFEMSELMARVEALVRRKGRDRRGGDWPIHEFDDCALDTRRQELRRGEETVPLSTQEYKLLEYFVTHPGEVLTRDELLDAVWGYEEVPYTRTVDVHVAWLRHKIGEGSHPRKIVTVRGRGYKFIPPDTN